jgi:cathepsin L
VAAIKEHNEKFARGQVSYSKGINQFTDMTEKEFLEHVNGEG